MIFSVEVKTEGEALTRGDLFYESRRLYRVEHVGKPHGKERRLKVRIKLLARMNLDRARRRDMVRL